MKHITVKFNSCCWNNIRNNDPFIQMYLIEKDQIVKDAYLIHVEVGGVWINMSRYFELNRNMRRYHDEKKTRKC